MFCTKCGSKAEDGNQYCSSCGALLSGEAQAYNSDFSRVQGKSTASPAVSICEKSKSPRKGRMLVLLVIIIAIVGASFFAVKSFFPGTPANPEGKPDGGKDETNSISTYEEGLKGKPVNDGAESGDREPTGSVGAGKQSSTGKSYANVRYDYSVIVPEGLTWLPEADNGDGREFTNDRGVHIWIYGSFNVFEQTCNEEYQQNLSEISGEIAYQVCKDSFYVISWLEEGNINYQKTFASGDHFCTLLFQYPQQAKGIGDQIVEEMVPTFQASAR